MKITVLVALLFTACTYDYAGLQRGNVGEDVDGGGSSDVSPADTTPGMEGGGGGTGGAGGAGGTGGGGIGGGAGGSGGGGVGGTDARPDAGSGDVMSMTETGGMADASPAFACDPSSNAVGLACPAGQECYAEFQAGLLVRSRCVAAWSTPNKHGAICTIANPSQCNPGIGCIPPPVSGPGTCLRLCRCVDGAKGTGCEDQGPDYVCSWYPTTGGLSDAVDCKAGDMGFGGGIGYCHYRRP